ncbi:esterase/lipase family protein [Leptospira sanjuanensis]|uniref:esterase/lipase family protein n=1 Tax=Leptospira sanjuanensis TaxID=2879643 RepID=UPI001EE7BE65|nr:alpha/beta hydrolase [Leptospira sanjuanensis]MCG6167113.1 alpha/beta hydrolase [Leptospira sanjuanensis]
MKFIFWTTLLSFSLLSCATYSTSVYSQFEQEKLVNRSGVSSNKLSLLTTRYLKSNDLFEKFERDPLVVIYDLDNLLLAHKSRELSYFLSELCYLTGNEMDREDPQFAKMYASALVYAYTYLFDKKASPAPDPFSAEFRFALLTYNRSLAQLVRYAKKNRKLASITDLSLPLIRGTLEMIGAETESAWSPQNFLQVEVAYDYRVKGFSNHISKYGIGTPLILNRKFPEDGSHTERTKYEFIAGVGQAYPATAFLSLEESYLGNRDLMNLKAKIHVYDPVFRDRIQLDGMDLPLESDTTTPLAYMLTIAQQRDDLLSVFDGETAITRKGLYLVYPYHKKKIPVVFLHGLASSPFIWFPMINELLSDPAIKEKYQFCVYWYPTAMPMVFSAADFRETLYDLRKTYDPKNENKNFDRAVLIGHSMGGLVAKLAVTESSVEEWMAAAEIPHSVFDSLNEESRKEIKKVLEFKPVPFVKRAVFIATPHRGSNLAEGIFGTIARFVFRLPKEVLKKIEYGYAFLNATHKKGELVAGVYGVDGLAPKSLFMKVTGNLKPQVKFHSIIGNSKLADLDWISDSVVPYESSHLDHPESEMLIESEHSVQNHLPTFLEVKRILKEHAKEN